MYYKHAGTIALFSLYMYNIAPPHLNNVPACKGVEKSNCTVGEKHLPYSSDAPPLQIAVNFTGNGPFHVQWFHNKTEFNCQSSCSNESNSTVQVSERDLLAIQD